MFGANALIAGMQRFVGEDMSYMRDLADASGQLLRAFLRFTRFSGYRRHAPQTLIHLARLGAVLVEDCGPCARISFRMARRDGVDADLLRAGLAGGEALTGDNALAFRFGQAISAGDSATADETGDAIEATHGRKVRTELAVAAATTRVFPAVKRGLGYASSCSLRAFDNL